MTLYTYDIIGMEKKLTMSTCKSKHYCIDPPPKKKDWNNSTEIQQNFWNSTKLHVHENTSIGKYLLHGVQKGTESMTMRLVKVVQGVKFAKLHLFRLKLPFKFK